MSSRQAPNLNRIWKLGIGDLLHMITIPQFPLNIGERLAQLSQCRRHQLDFVVNLTAVIWLFGGQLLTIVEPFSSGEKRRQPNDDDRQRRWLGNMVVEHTEGSTICIGG